MPKSDPRRDQLLKAMGQLVQHKNQLAEHRKALVNRARSQVDTMPRALHVAGEHVKAGHGGGVLAGRYHRTLVQERRGLDQLIADHGGD